MNKLVCLITFIMLMVASSKTDFLSDQGESDYGLDQLINKLGDTDCAKATIHDYACHHGCHNTSTYISDCDTYNGSCDFLFTRFDFCNMTGCRNTTRRVEACYTDNCATGQIHYNSCYETTCIRNRTTHVHACYSNSNIGMSLFKVLCNMAAAVVPYLDDTVRAFFDSTCVDRLITAFQRRRR